VAGTTVPSRANVLTTCRSRCPALADLFRDRRVA